MYIRYAGHDPNNKLSRAVNDVYKRIIILLDSDNIFTSLAYGPLVQEFKSDWKNIIKKPLEQHINFAEFWTNDIIPSNMIVLYPTNIANGKVYIKSIITPVTILKKPTSKKDVIYSSKLRYQVNLEIGIYTEDGTKSCMLENLYITES